MKQHHILSLSSSAEMQDSKPEGLWNCISSRLNARQQTDWAIEDQAKTWTQQPVPLISEHSAHLIPLPFVICTWLWRYTCLFLLISMLWHRQAIFASKEIGCLTLLNAGFEPRRSLEHNRQQTECPLTNRLSYWGSSKNLNSPARPYDQRVFSPFNPTAVWPSHLALAIYMFVVVNFDALAQASGFRIERRKVVFLCWDHQGPTLLTKIKRHVIWVYC